MITYPKKEIGYEVEVSVKDWKGRIVLAFKILFGIKSKVKARIKKVE